MLALSAAGGHTSSDTALYGWRRIRLVESSKGNATMTTAAARTRTHAGGRTHVRPGETAQESRFKKTAPNRAIQSPEEQLAEAIILAGRAMAGVRPAPSPRRQTT